MRAGLGFTRVNNDMLLIAHPTIGRLFVAQALFWTCSTMAITLTALVGAQLTPVPLLATLPLALAVLGNLMAVQPLSLFMQRHGRRPGLLLGSLAGVLAGLICAAGIGLGSFWLFCLGALPIGAYQASANFYRFAALDAVDAAHKGRAAAYVIGGGVCAALVAPSLAVWSQGALRTPFLGAYLMLSVLAAISIAVLAGLREGAVPRPSTGGWAVMRGLLARPLVLAAMATTAAGHGTMVLVMNATPLAMSFCGFDVSRSATVIQWHVLGMFLPAFVAGPLVDRLGCRRVALIGGLTLLTSVGIAVSGIAFSQFLVSSFLLGVGWNLMMVSGTTWLGEGHSADERGHAQGLMELGNGIVAATAAFAAGGLINGVGWNAVNIGVIPLIAVAAVIGVGGSLVARRANA